MVATSSDALAAGKTPIGVGAQSVLVGGGGGNSCFTSHFLISLFNIAVSNYATVNLKMTTGTAI